MSRAVQFPSNVSMFNPAPFPPIDRKITSIREHEGDFTSNQQASYEFLSYLFIPLEYSTFLYIYIFLGKIDRLTGSTNCRKRGKTRQVGNNPCEGGTTNIVSVAGRKRWVCLGFEDYDVIGIIDGHDLPRLRRGSPVTFRAYHPDLWIKRTEGAAPPFHFEGEGGMRERREK